MEVESKMKKGWVRSIDYQNSYLQKCSDVERMNKVHEKDNKTI